MKLRLTSILLFPLITLLIFSHSTSAAPLNPDKPFAEHHIVLQISDISSDKQTLVLNVANNLIKQYGPDQVDIEIVAFGPGLRLLLEGNSNQNRIDGLVESGVRFAACANTLNKFSKALGKEPPLHIGAHRVSAGVVRIIDLTKKGYLLIRP